MDQAVLESLSNRSLYSMPPVKHPVLFITGTDTGVGKTVLACLVTRYLREAGVRVAALKPVSSGNRNDARLLRAAAGDVLSVDQINPWHFRAPLAPLAAARRERRTVKLAEVVAHVGRIGGQFQVVVVEGAGGLLSPLGGNFDSRDLIIALKATPVVVCPNRLGAINQSLLVQSALPPRTARHAQVVLVSPKHPDAAGRTNPPLLAERLGAARVHVVPWLGCPYQPGLALAERRVRTAIRALVKSAGW
jgi:dethiobiotin synthetase